MKKCKEKRKEKINKREGIDSLVDSSLRGQEKSSGLFGTLHLPQSRQLKSCFHPDLSPDLWVPAAGEKRKRCSKSSNTCNVPV